MGFKGVHITRTCFPDGAVISLKNKDTVNSVPHTCYNMNGKVGPVKGRHYSYFVGNQPKLKHNHTIEPFTARQIQLFYPFRIKFKKIAAHAHMDDLSIINLVLS